MMPRGLLLLLVCVLCHSTVGFVVLHSKNVAAAVIQKHGQCRQPQTWALSATLPDSSSILEASNQVVSSINNVENYLGLRTGDATSFSAIATFFSAIATVFSSSVTFVGIIGGFVVINGMKENDDKRMKREDLDYLDVIEKRIKATRIKVASTTGETKDAALKKLNNYESLLEEYTNDLFATTTTESSSYEVTAGQLFVGSVALMFVGRFL